MDRVACTITFYYDPDTYLYEWENTRPSDEEILRRCKVMMLEDVSSIDDPLSIDAVAAKFTDEFPRLIDITEVLSNEPDE